MKKTVFSFSFVLWALSCLAWGQKGHDVVAFIAEKHLDAKVLARVEAVLGNHSTVYYSNWLDNASHTDEYAYTKTWHYKNVDANESYANARLNPKGDVVRAITDISNMLREGNLAPEKEKVYLMMLIHLVGDLHQPMHMGHADDLGGNKHNVIYFNRDSNLHSVWDNALVESAHKWSYTEWQREIDRIDEASFSAITEGSVDDWGRETCELAGKVYDATPIGCKISYDYVAQWTPVIEQQFLKGGCRLAALLNSIYGK
ncbi:MAG: S1/P1 nuclease [Muribaculaceae bacterium]